MKRKLMSVAGAMVLAAAVVAPASASANNGVGSCHAAILHLAKDITGNTSTAATAADFGLTVQQGQQLIKSICGHNT